MFFQVTDMVDLCPDKAALEVTVNHTRGLWTRCPDRNRPGFDFLGASREIALEPQQLVNPSCQGRQRWLVEIQALEHLQLVSFVELGQFAFDL